MEELISIVVPIYNVEQYLRKCIDSILDQSYKNLEIILVDDGSPDSSGKICDEYAKEDIRVRVIHQENTGLSGARNAGLEIANGKYISFIDSDDWIDSKFIETLYHDMKENNAQIAAPGFCLAYEDGSYVNDSKVDKLTIYNTQEALETFLFNGYLTPCVASKLWDIELWSDVRCPRGKLYEDQYTTYKLLDKTKRITFDPSVKYYYFKRNGSIGHSDFNKKTYDLLDGIKEEYHFITEKYPETTDTMKVARAFWELVFVNMMINSNAVDKDAVNSIRQRTRSALKEICNCAYIDRVRKMELLLFTVNFPLYQISYRLYKKQHKIA